MRPHGGCSGAGTTLGALMRRLLRELWRRKQATSIQ
ncbi:hypothetical protein EV672_101544 [Aquabacterium commune]|uniref:Uncharacterized protein n=1 Tax=Aquabacterium commune TaxID=70586 RepID=A0A4R6RQF2_9BURK|nr:hypothetical protein EV672_101544 [Aquabacterium commune]